LSLFSNNSTASSFNNPFTTLSYYNWLFEKETWPTLGVENSHPADSSSISSFDILPNSSSQHYTNRQNRVELPRSSGTVTQTFKHLDPAFDMSRASSGFSRRSFSQESMSPETSAANQILALSMAGTHMAASLGYVETGFSSPIPNRIHRSGLDYLPTPVTSGSSCELDNNLDHSKQTRKLPVIDEVARQSVLTLIDRGRPKIPDGLEITRDHSLLSLTALQDYCDLYFTRFNISYPLLHQATFNPAKIDPLLLTSVLLLGATYSDRESHLFAICVHDIMRAQILGSPDFTPRPPLWILQTILLVECFGKSRAGQLQHDMSHLFHGLLIK
jgi:hypothetical protein